MHCLISSNKFIILPVATKQIMRICVNIAIFLYFRKLLCHFFTLFCIPQYFAMKNLALSLFAKVNYINILLNLLFNLWTSVCTIIYKNFNVDLLLSEEGQVKC